MISIEGQIETTDTGAQDNMSESLRAGSRRYNLLKDTTVRNNIIHFNSDRVPKRVVYALSHGA